ncbi:hypothetical protein GCM10007860_15960 [Chitiniphilus shinanonensis]|nr:hypothetical protein [Chitiniphilus shinanonensis]GLS04449.1 hypothetical protein GCM10007860_15960 [Chitiniphilus shinanonensis]
MSARLGWLYPYALLYLFILIVAFYFPDIAPMADEGIHLYQIQHFHAGHLDLHGALTNIPGYHWLMALLTMPVETPSVVLVRRINAFFALGTLTTLMVLTYQVRGRLCITRVTQLLFMPLVLPFYFLIYTDAVSLLLILLCLSLGLSNRMLLAAVIGTLSLGIRQNNIVWLAMMPFLLYATEGGAWTDRRRLLRHVLRCWPFGLCAVAFLAFYFINGGVAVGDQWAHPPLAIHCGNFFFMLLVYLVLFLPAIVSHLPKTRAFVLALPHKGLLLTLLLMVYLFGFTNSHPYNQVYPEYFLRNMVLMTMVSSVWIKVLCFPLMALALCDFLARCPGRPAWVVIGVFAVLAVVPAWLIEQRYYMVPLLLMLLYRDEEAPWAEAATTWFYLFAGAVCTYGMTTHRFFM